MTARPPVRCSLALTALVAACSAASRRSPPAASPARVEAAGDASTPPADAASPAGRAAVTYPPCRRDLSPAAALRLDETNAIPEMPADPLPALAAACRRLAAATAAHYRRVRRGDADPAQFQSSELGVCLPAGRGAWAFEVTALRIGPTVDEGAQTYEGQWRLVYLDPAGRTLPSPVSGALTLRGQGSHRPARSWVIDVDGDGVGELRFVSETDWVEESYTDGTWVMQARDGAVRPFAPLASVSCASPADVDGDGRVDFLVPPPYRIPAPGLRDDQTLTGLSMVLHGRADLSWAADDDVAREFVRQRCAATPEGPPFYRAPDARPDATLDDSITRLTCARFRGVPVEALERALRAELGAMASPTAEAEMYGSGTLVGTLAALRPEPPFTVEARCAP
jgi:hypothetical protein